VLTTLLIGLPGHRPGGLALSLLLGVGSATVALLAGFGYATVCVALPRASLPLQGAMAFIRGIPLLILVFMAGTGTPLPLVLAGFLALCLYSLCHVGEIFRGFLGSYPRLLRDQARLTGLSPPAEWLVLRVPWALRRSLAALGTHWISLYKDTGALTVLAVGELTSIVQLLSQTVSTERWIRILAGAAALYLATSLAIAAALRLLIRRVSI
jgi:ABC-type amino acid transport system permease subunit